MFKIDLNTVEGLPFNIFRNLEIHRHRFLQQDFFDQLVDDQEISEIIDELDAFCLANRVIGYHYTRAYPDDIKTYVLQCLTGDEIRHKFLERFGYIFSTVELAVMHENWDQYYDEEQKKIRDRLIWFNFTTCALRDGGAQPLLSNFGGEQVYMALQECNAITQKIRRIGEPLIVKCTLDPSQIKTFTSRPWGKIGVSTFHCSINSNALRFDQDGRIDSNVFPENLEVIKMVRHF